MKYIVIRKGFGAGPGIMFEQIEGGFDYDIKTARLYNTRDDAESSIEDELRDPKYDSYMDECTFGVLKV